MSQLVEHDNILFVGDYIFDLPCSPSPTSHPKNFYAIANSMRIKHYSNNCEYIRWFPRDQVFCVRKINGGVLIAGITEHPEYEKLKNLDLDSGELFSLFGSDWIQHSAATVDEQAGQVVEGIRKRIGEC